MFLTSYALAKLTFAASNFVTNCSISSGHAFFFLPHWWEYLGGSYDALGQCSPVFSFPGSILPVGLAVLDMLLRLAGFAAVIGIIIGGVQHQFTGGNPEKAAGARKRLYNSLIGLGIALTATAAVSFIGRQIGG